MSKIETKQIALVSENGLVEKTLSIDNSGVVTKDYAHLPLKIQKICELWLK